jgi:ABC-type transporter Mla subunit MlaD
MDNVIAFLIGIQELLKQTLFSWFARPELAIGLSLTILATGALVCLWLIFRLAIPTRLRLNQIRREILAAESEIDFTTKYNQIDEKISSYAYLQHGWAEFKETLILPAEGEHPQIIRNTARPAFYLDLDTAESAGLNLKRFQAWPNYFVGFGLLFTFLGLVAAIYFASQGLTDSAEFGKAKEALNGLLSAATFKFLTSIAGVFSSLIVGITYRSSAGVIQQGFSRICTALEERLAFVTPESIAFDQYRQLVVQSEQLERFNTDLAFSIAKELDKSLPASLGTALQPLATTLEGMSNKFGEMNQDAVGNMLTEFQEQLRGSAGKEIEAVGETLVQTRNSLADLVSSLNATSSDLRTSIMGASERLESTANSLETSLKAGMTDSANELQTQLAGMASTFKEQITEGGARLLVGLSSASKQATDMLSPVQGGISELSSTLNILNKSLSDQLQQVESIGRESGSLAESIRDASGELRVAGQPIATAAQSIRESVKQMESAVTISSDAQSSLLDLTKLLSTSTEDLTQQWSQYAERFEGVDKDLAQTFTNLAEATRNQQAVVAEFVGNLDQELNKAMRQLSGGINDLGSVVEEVTESVDKLNYTLSRGRS